MGKKVAGLLEKMKNTHSKWSVSGYSSIQSETKEKCSFSPLLMGVNVSHPLYSGKTDSIRVVTNPSPEQLALFIVDQLIIDRHFINSQARVTPEQVHCAGHDCVEVTQGIYLNNEEASNEDLLYKELAYALGLITP